MTPDESPLVLFAYDGSDLAKAAIREAARLLPAASEAVVVTAWEPLDVKFVPVGPTAIPPLMEEVGDAAKKTAAEGAALAAGAGFRAQAAAIQATPTWKGLVDAAEQHRASVIVLGSHGRSGLSGVLLGSVAGAVAAHFGRSVLIVHGGERG